MRVFAVDMAAEHILLPDGTDVGSAQVIYSEGAAWFALWRGDAKSWLATFDVDEAMVVTAGTLRFESADGEVAFVEAGGAVVFRVGDVGRFSISDGFSAWVLVNAPG